MNPTGTPAPPPPRTEPGPVRPTGSLPVSSGLPASRRRWVWVAVCAVVAVLAMLGVLAAISQVSDRVQVVAVARNVPVGHEITAKDLTVAQVASDPALKPVPASQRKNLVGQYATVSLRAGTLLTGSQVSEKNTLTDGKQVLGVQAERGQLPHKTLQPGDSVLVVATPAKGTAADPAAQKEAGDTDAPIEATVVDVSAPDRSGNVVVNLAVSTVDGPVLAKQAASGDIALLLEPRS